MLEAFLILALRSPIHRAAIGPPLSYGVVWESRFSPWELRLGSCRDSIPYPEQSLDLGLIYTRPAHPDSAWRLTWTLGLARCAGQVVLYGIPRPRTDTWIKRAVRDSAGNVSCFSDSQLVTGSTP